VHSHNSITKIVSEQNTQKCGGPSYASSDVRMQHGPSWNHNREFSLELGQNSKLLLETPLHEFWSTVKERPAIMDREGGRVKFLIAPICSLRYSCCARSTKTKTDVSYIHFIILTLKTLFKIIACKDKGKGDRDQNVLKIWSHTVNFLKELFIDNFQNDEHWRYLQYFPANPTSTVKIKISSPDAFPLEKFRRKIALFP
jgi:hypothetical protein